MRGNNSADWRDKITLMLGGIAIGGGVGSVFGPLFIFVGALLGVAAIFWMDQRESGDDQ